MVKQLAFVRHVVRPIQHLLDVLVAFLRAFNGDALGLAHHAGGQLLNTRRKSGAEHHGLATLNRQLVHLGQIVAKAQIEHAVGFVHNQEFHRFTLDLSAALQVEQAAGCSHNQGGILQLGNLQLVRHAAYN